MCVRARGCVCVCTNNSKCIHVGEMEGGERRRDRAGDTEERDGEEGGRIGGYRERRNRRHREREREREGVGGGEREI